MPKPLVDLTPQYREPPQHLKKGKGYRPETMGGGPLIQSATSPEDPMGIPPSTDWQRSRNQHLHGSPAAVALSSTPPQESAFQPGINLLNRQDSIQRKATLNGRSVRQRPYTSGRESTSATAAAFTGEGLLAGSQAQSGWGGGDKGRPVAHDRTKGPMLDMSMKSTFAHGSLLNKVAKEQIAAPIIDRSREED